LGRLRAILWNTYREAVRARILLGLFALALATDGYAVIVGQYAARNASRVVSDLGAASLSLYALVASIVLGATSLHRELELKTLFPILARPVHRAEYLVGKYFGFLLTVAVFVAGNAGVLLLLLSLVGDGEALLGVLGAVGVIVLCFTLAWFVPRLRTALPAVGALLLLGTTFFLSRGLPVDRRIVLGAGVLTLFEVAIVLAVAQLFSAFSRPFLTAVFSVGIIVVGRSADTLARLPAKVFGEPMHQLGVVLSHVFPNLMVYVPPRAILSGESADVAAMDYYLLAGGQAFAWSVGLLAAACLIFRKRDFL
jgi:ABC-type transport system involved in multi-copper enzyme maturation permease subunit